MADCSCCFTTRRKNEFHCISTDENRHYSRAKGHLVDIKWNYCQGNKLYILKEFGFDPFHIFYSFFLSVLQQIYDIIIYNIILKVGINPNKWFWSMWDLEICHFQTFAQTWCPFSDLAAGMNQLTINISFINIDSLYIKKTTIQYFLFDHLCLECVNVWSERMSCRKMPDVN